MLKVEINKYSAAATGRYEGASRFGRVINFFFILYEQQLSFRSRSIKKKSGFKFRCIRSIFVENFVILRHELKRNGMNLRKHFFNPYGKVESMIQIKSNKLFNARC